MTVKKIIDWANENPKKLFKIDGFGAILSAVLLGVVLVKLEHLFGIPKPTLYFLASLPCLFAIYDVCCYYKADKNIGVFLKGIGITNLGYCCLSIGLAIYHREKVTDWGWIYILIEVLVVCTLALIQLGVAKRQI
ncbi:hypothetical protein [uncultured Zobellia sp.]|uniref:hypothetical protein n=1 Tax=uncultured Zobellia sp. TaxID=255433 RepID=UPI0025994396|nr:hypothetical protein [uncultured Zobellia sp.]